MKLILIGKARHGKDTVAEYLRGKYGMPFRSSSEAALDIFLYDQINMTRAWAHLPPYPTKKEAFEDRVNHRKLWYEMIKEYNRIDKARLAKDILATKDIYVGMRCQEELAAARNAVDFVIWIDAEQRLGDTESKGSITVLKGDADIIIDNNRSLEELYADIDSLMVAMQGL